MILVTGAGGAVGSAVLNELRSAGRLVRAGYHSPAMAHAAAQEGFDAVAIEMSQPATLTAALAGVESVFLLGAMSPEQTRHELAVLTAAQACGAVRVVKLSVWRADERLTPIAQLHQPVEEALQASSLAWTFLRPNFYMQNFSRQMAATIKTSGTIAQPATRAAISFVDVRDVARVAAHVLTSSGHHRQSYALTGPEALSYEQVAATFSSVLKRPVRFVALSDQQARDAMLKLGLSEFHVNALIGVSAAYRDGGAERITTTVADLTGHRPHTLRQFVADHRCSFQ